MIPRLAEANPIQSLYLSFIESLKQRGFRGDLNPDYANRVVLATDNSIYQILPQGVLYPRDLEDLQRIARLAQEPRFHGIVLSARGGGTGTNGQSLTDGLVVDISRHMNRILEINAEERWVRVQTGVVKDQLNAALKPYGLFFAPELSTSNRATIGGMINTDASGQGSCQYGKTRDHVLALKSVLLDGSVIDTHAMSSEELAAAQQRDGLEGSLYRLADQIFNDNRDAIEAGFPKLNRCLTGYDLAHIVDEKAQFNLNSLLCGSEGTLAFIAEAKLNVLPIPKCAALVNLKYDSFDAALRDAQDLMKAGPTSIETVDSKVLNLAMEDIVWDTVRDYFPDDGQPISGINLVEYTADDETTLQQKVATLTDQLDQQQGQPGKSIGYTVAYGAGEINKIWTMRKKSVGLLGNAKGEKRPIPFVEDTAVPPENLADFIAEFRALLDAHGMEYGMFGHVDAGVLHVRPAIDMKDPLQEAAIRTITDGVVALTQKYHGLLWGEHGKGVRSEYAPAFFGPQLYGCLQRIKAAFDPRNQLNPGKICTPADSSAELLAIDGVPTRGQHDRQIPAPVRQHFSEAMYCNGNGACYNYDPNDAMCPSWKGSRERIHSPKGRASLMREWLRLLSDKGINPASEARKLRQRLPGTALLKRTLNSLGKGRGEYDFSHEVMDAMAGCLACKSCVSQCPIKVNVPEFRAQFMELYYGRYLRPVRHYLIAGLEFMIPWLAKFPRPYNWVIQNSLGRKLFRQQVGMVDSPSICTHDLARALQERHIAWATPEALRQLSDADRQLSVVLVQDAFTSYFETQLVLDCCDLLQRLGFRVFVAPYAANGKPLHVHGFMQRFEKTARNNAEHLKRLADCGVALAGIDPSMTLTYRQEYIKTLPDMELPQVALLQEWLAKQKSHLEGLNLQLPDGDFRLLSHCTERTSAPASVNQWQQVFAALGQSLSHQSTGCCGMAGTYGHETGNLETSEAIYRQSWGEVIAAEEKPERLVATGYSCRSQAKRMDQRQLPHPAQALLKQLRQGG